ncbi:M3 family metallopeptidase [Bacteroides helcogenes]|uniref:Peptidyl-dipeptidase Dcp n=1 Tax=Bacteroides helcogenes (strain ATCC 35417 / DSM 20613 / JCM 6297 / CCUG 15421 / P 36-108) TaxID=693979 RepID=E6SV71_BACT6|nr:M3 family metallopeptidase [Bacteroides helcogenes]ADV43453.1 peptidyl-dipeptidase Dcp [Bacteroides helcogenes P 36-108]MDY5239058.1 M3 family metallopeptidase [Bacteroides helcogenes]
MNNTSNKNPFLDAYSTPHGTFPFDKIKPGDYKPAIDEGIRRQNAEIDVIINNIENPTFANTVLPYEKSGELLHNVNTVFNNLLSAETNDELQELAKEIMPLMSEHENNISLNEDLFARIKSVYDQRQKEDLNKEQSKLLEDIYNGFVRNGANLHGEAKDKYRGLCKELSLLTLQFSENNLKETNNYRLILTEKSQLAGLPESAIEAATETAKEKGVEGWVFTLQAPSYGPFMTYADNRALRRELYMAYNTKCTHNNECNNLEVVKRIANIHMEIAQLLGYTNFAEYNLQERMAQDSDTVYKLLNQLLDTYTPAAKQEYAEVQALAQQQQGGDFVLMPWDWAYYSHKLKDRKFNIDDEMLRPYFELNKVKEGVFGLATKLYGITFKKNPEIPVYHKDVDAYEVFDKDDKFLAVFYTDFHPRASKRSGAWMTSYKGQWIDERTGENSRPHISIVMNFTKPTQEKPALLTFSEVETLLHEFGHSLHGIFANTTYESMSGTNVYWDFVELPSQFMENFATEKEFLHTFARHYQTGELIPDELVQRIVDSSNFNAAYACLRQVSFGLLDMAWYTRNTPFDGDVKAYEKKAWEKAQILPSVEEACMSTQFSHIFAGGYSAGYYSYKWAEVLDADAFALFKEKGIFNSETASSFRENILSKGGTEHPMALYKRFRGQEPTIDALLIRNGIKK